MSAVTNLKTILADGPTFWMPIQAAQNADRIDGTFYFIFYLSLIFFIGVAVAMFLFMWRFRRRRDDEQARVQITHSTPLELTWTIIPSILLIPMFWWGMVEFLNARTPPETTYDINVRAYKWAWQFFYPNGHDDTRLHVPAGVPVRLIMQSDDVIHSLFIPAFRVKRDVVPGRYSFLWFEAKHIPKDPSKPNEPVEYALYCTEYCGTSHSDMNTLVVVHPNRAAFDEWLANANPLSEKNMSPEMWQDYLNLKFEEFIAKYPQFRDRLGPIVEHGKLLYTRKGCATCHSVAREPSAMNCPPFWGLLGKERQFKDGGAVVADENYVRESIINPNAHIVVGYDAIMPKIAISDREIASLISYLKTLKD